MVHVKGAALGVALGLAILTAACAGGSRRAAPENQQTTVDAGSIQLQPLPAQTLGAGQCGLFLWTPSAQEPTLVAAAFNTPSEARIRVEGRTRTLPRLTAEGQLNHGHFERQSFSDGQITLVLDVQFDRNRELRDGAALEGGSLRIRDGQGWEAVMPVGGMVACQS
ncbi:MAG: hypothetical protein R3C25_08230 [Hyphomonadaceae bacterium]